MGRGLDRDDDPREVESTPASGVSGSTDARERTVATSAPRPFALPTGRWRQTVAVRDRTYRLRGSESRTLEVAGVFRVAFTRDLERGVYHGDGARMARDLEVLSAAGLLQRRPFTRGSEGQRLEAVTLTPDARALLEAHRTHEGERPQDGHQAVYDGFVRPTELLHDATLYRLFLDEQERLSPARVVRRVLLDHELKAECFRAAHRDGLLTPVERRAHLAEAAARLDLPVVDGHVRFPDLRLEVEDAAGTRTRVDLELATEAYRAGQLRAKATAGFAIYRAVSGGAGRAQLVRSGGSSGRGAAGHDRDLASQLLSL